MARSLSLRLAPLTLGRHLAVRACVRASWSEDGEAAPDLAALPDADLLAFIDTALADPPEKAASRDALVALASAVWEAWSASVAEAVATGTARAKLVRLYTGCAGTGRQTFGPAPPEEAVWGRLSLSEWAAAREVPLWEAVALGAAAASWAEFERTLATN